MQAEHSMYEICTVVEQPDHRCGDDLVPFAYIINSFVVVVI